MIKYTASPASPISHLHLPYFHLQFVIFYLAVYAKYCNGSISKVVSTLASDCATRGHAGTRDQSNSTARERTVVMVAGAHIPYEPVKDEEDAIDSDSTLGWRNEESPHNAAAAAWAKRAGILAAGCLAVAGLVKTNQLPTDGLFRDSALESSAERAKSTLAKTTTTTTTTSASIGPINFAVGNKQRSLAANDLREAWVVDYPWTSKIIEPHTDTTFEARGCDSCPDASFEWTIQATKSGGYEVSSSSSAAATTSTTLVGRSVTFKAAGVGEHTVKLTVTHPTDGTTAQLASSVQSKYVRREIRSLGDAERTATLKAMHTLWTVDMSSSGGVEKYGPKFKDIAYFVAKHLQGSAQRECDGWHDGAGFYTHHAAFSIEFEQAMQAVDPSVSLPYWDTTLDNHNQAYATPALMWQSSDLWANGDRAWFGDLDSAKSAGREDHAISQGTWALTKVKQVGTSNEKYPDANPYGLLRSPWNTNPSAYVSRSPTVAGTSASFGGELPSCQASAWCYASSSMAEMNECLNGATHGSAHILIGGIWHKSIADDSLVDPAQAYQLLLISKDLWRRGYVKCPSECDAATETDTATGGACVCSFNKESVPEGSSSYDILTTHTGVMHWVDLVSSEISFDSDKNKYVIDGVSDPTEVDKAWDHMLHDTLSDLGQVGEMYTSSSPYDPAFWILHGTVDRLVHWKRLVATAATKAAPDSATLFDLTWGYAHDGDASSDSHAVCDWSAVEAGTAAMPACVKGTCAGHLADSVLPFSGLVHTTNDDQDNGDQAGYTNLEMFDYLAPDSEDLSYVYDDFSWSHCAYEGYAFGVNTTTGEVNLAYQRPTSKEALENVYV